MTNTNHESAAGALCTTGADGCCTGCGVSMDTCETCKGIDYHRAGRAESDDAAPPFAYVSAPKLSDDQLDAIWQRAGQAQDYTMIDLVERALDGDEFSRRLVAMSARDVSIYAEVIR